MDKINVLYIQCPSCPSVFMGRLSHDMMVGDLITKNEYVHM